MWEEDTSYRTNAVRVTLSKLRHEMGAARDRDRAGAGYRIGDGPAAGTGSGPAPLTGPEDAR
ncbi:DNA-binding response regulator OS=Streptomyces microflavus OX=1919 GN=Smic_46770 PE=4 SV=1 [Streptomyces microflavus]